MLLGNRQVDILGIGILKEVSYVVIDGWGLPAAQAAPGIFGVVVLTRAAASGSCGTAISVVGVIGQILDLGTPCHGTGGTVCRRINRTVIIHRVTITLGIHSLTLELARYAVGCNVEVQGDGRFLTVDPAALGRDDNHTVAGTHTVQGACGLTLEHVDALDVIRVQVNRAVGIISTRHTLTCREVGRRGDGHTVNYIQRSVVAAERTGTTNHDLGR